MKFYLILFNIFIFFTMQGQDLVSYNPGANDSQNQMPQFPGGKDSLKTIFEEQLVKPALNKQPQLSGIIHVEFVVNDEGEVQNARVVKGLSKELDKEAITILLSLPKWQPGKKQGKPADFYYQMPIYVGEM